jgi:hypothetical protein
MEADEEELEDLMKLESGETEEEEEPTVEDEPKVAKVKEEPAEEDEPKLSKEESTFKKRYGDLRRHQQEQEAKYKAEI